MNALYRRERLKGEFRGVYIYISNPVMDVDSALVKGKKRIACRLNRCELFYRGIYDFFLFIDFNGNYSRIKI